MTDSPGQPYRAFLLRWWQEGKILTADQSFWRFSLEEIGGQLPRRGFGSLAELMAFLEAELGGRSPDLAQIDDPEE